MDEQAQYDAYEEAFYQGAEWAHEQAAEKEELPNPDQERHKQDVTVESNYIVASPCKPRFKCRRCQEVFKSNNLLHRHLLSGLHPKASAPASGRMFGSRERRS